jgi:hypothetical protein
MPVKYCFLDHSAQIEAEGTLTTRQVTQAIQSIISDPRSHSGMELVCDLRLIDASKVDAKKISIAAELIAFFLPYFNSRIHIIVSSNVQYGLTRMYHAYSCKFNINVLIYRSIEEAYQSLDEPVALKTIKLYQEEFYQPLSLP